MKTFAELDLISPVRKALVDEKYEIPTPIQAQTMPAALSGRDVLGCAQTGTGKTAAFALPILNRLGKENQRSQPNRPLVLVLAPTRELTIQIGDSFATYGNHLKLRHVLVYGGVSQNNQVRALGRGVHILVATPGRLLDLMNQGYIHLDQLQVFVLDETERGIDIDGVTHLINYNLPVEPESYVHRIGRTGRAGAEGITLSFCSADERRDLRAIEQLIGQKEPLAPGQPAPQPVSEGSKQPVPPRGGRRNSRVQQSSKASASQQTAGRGID